jgi:hypothetical protein
MASDVKSPERRVIGWVCLLFLLACFSPCIDSGPEVASSDPGWPDSSAGCHFGLEILLFGWSGGNHGVPWSANAFLALGLLCLWLRRRRTAAVMGIVASGLGLTTWLLNSFSRPHDIHVLVGYYFWQASQFVLAVGASWASRKPLRDPTVVGHNGSAAVPAPAETTVAVNRRQSRPPEHSESRMTSSDT